jgi:hypothetical protein
MTDGRNLRIDQHCSDSTINDLNDKGERKNTNILNKYIPKHAYCMQQGTKVIVKKKHGKRIHVLAFGQIQHHTSLSNCLLIFKHGGGCIMV